MEDRYSEATRRRLAAFLNNENNAGFFKSDIGHCAFRRTARVFIVDQIAGRAHAPSKWRSAVQRDQNTVDDSASYDEALRLTLAFYCIMEPDKRAIILSLAERYAERQPPVVEKAIHRER